jgi:NADPH:quinone reductase-like Zn-dependent oxidoreductase
MARPVRQRKGKRAVAGTGQMDLVRSLGADAIIDYTKNDFTQLDGRYDLIAVFGGGDSVSRLRRALTPKGTLVLAGGEGGGKWLGRGGRLIYAPFLSPFVSQRLVGFSVKQPRRSSALRGLIEAGEVTPVVGRTYQLSEVPTRCATSSLGRAEAARPSSRSENRLMTSAPITRPSRTPDGRLRSHRGHPWDA